MKKIILLILLIVASMFASTITLQRCIETKIEPEPITPELTWEDGWADFIPALIQVESKGDPKALGKNNDRGVLQITPTLVKEVNRISGMCYTHDDAWDPEKSVEMFYIIARKYCPEHDFEKMARIWNGGPKGCSKPRTIAYWNKVREEMEANKIS